MTESTKKIEDGLTARNFFGVSVKNFKGQGVFSSFNITNGRANIR